MFTATGIGARKNEDGTIAIKVRVTRDSDGKALFEQAFQGKDQADIKAQVDAVLLKLQTAEDDASLQKTFVGQVISTI